MYVTILSHCFIKLTFIAGGGPVEVEISSEFIIEENENSNGMEQRRRILALS